jgi:hypothetical protein
MRHAPKLKRLAWTHRGDAFQEHLQHTFEALALADGRLSGLSAAEEQEIRMNDCDLCATGDERVKLIICDDASSTGLK